MRNKKQTKYWSKGLTLILHKGLLKMDTQISGIELNEMIKEKQSKMLPNRLK